MKAEMKAPEDFYSSPPLATILTNVSKSTVWSSFHPLVSSLKVVIHHVLNLKTPQSFILPGVLLLPVRPQITPVQHEAKIPDPHLTSTARIHQPGKSRGLNIRVGGKNRYCSIHLLPEHGQEIDVGVAVAKGVVRVQQVEELVHVQGAAAVEVDLEGRKERVHSQDISALGSTRNEWTKCNWWRLLPPCLRHDLQDLLLRGVVPHGLEHVPQLGQADGPVVVEIEQPRDFENCALGPLF